MIWKILKSSYSFICPWLRVRKDCVVLPSGFEMEDFYVLESNDWVNVIAITEDGYFIVEKQYRHGIGRVCFELPAGNVSKGEAPLDAAKRELLEETGYTGGDWKCFCTLAPNASGMNNLCYTFLATGVKRVASPHLEKSEDIRVFLMTLNEIENLLIEESIIEAVMQAPLWRYINVRKWA